MKAFLKLCAICLVTFILVSPALILWRVWQSHCDLLAEPDLLTPHDLIAQRLPASDGLISPPVDLAVSPLAALQMPVASAAFIPLYLGFVGAVLLGFYAGLLLNHRYQAHRNRALKRQVATLEKIWQQSIFE